MYTKTPSTLLLALFALLLVSVNALPKMFLQANATPTPTTLLPSASLSMQASSQVPSSETDPTLHAVPNTPLAEFEEGSEIEATSTTSSTTPSPSASATSLASSLSLLTSLTGWLSSLQGLLGLA